MILHWENGSRCISVGNNQGVIKIYEINSDLNADFTEIEDYMTKTFSQESFMKDWGRRTNPSATDLNGDGYPDMLIGNDRGGISFVEGNKKTNSIAKNQKLSTFEIVPNPVNQYFKIVTKTNKNIEYKISDMSGKILAIGNTFSGNIIPVNEYPNGVYFVSIEDGVKKYAIQKLILLKL